MSDLRTRLVRLASELPKGSSDRKAVLELVGGIGGDPIRRWKGGDPSEKKRVLGEQVQRASDIMRMVKIMADKTEGLDRSVASDAKRLTRSLDNLSMNLL